MLGDTKESELPVWDKHYHTNTTKVQKGEDIKVSGPVHFQRIQVVTSFSPAWTVSSLNTTMTGYTET